MEGQYYQFMLEERRNSAIFRKSEPSNLRNSQRLSAIPLSSDDESCSPQKKCNKDRFIIKRGHESFKRKDNLEEDDIDPFCQGLRLQLHSKTIKSTMMDEEVQMALKRRLLAVKFQEQPKKRKALDLIEGAYQIMPNDERGAISRKRIQWWTGNDPQDEFVYFIWNNYIYAHIDRFRQIPKPDCDPYAIATVDNSILLVSDCTGKIFMRDLLQSCNIRTINTSKSVWCNSIVHDLTTYNYKNQCDYLLAIAGDKLNVYDFSQREPEVCEFMGQSVESVTVMSQYCACSISSDHYRLIFWDLRNCSEPGKLFTQNDFIKLFDFSPQDPTMVVYASENMNSTWSLTLLNASQSRVLDKKPLVGSINSLCWHSDGRISAVHDMEVVGFSVWRVHNNTLVEDERLVTEPQFKTHIFQACGSKKNSKIITVGDYDLYSPYDPLDNYTILKF